MLQNGGYGNVVFNILFLLQIRVSKYFEGEDFNDEQFSHYFYKLYDMLLTFEHGIQSPIQYSQCLADIVESMAGLKFTAQGVRIQKIPKLNQKKARTNEISFRIRNNRGNLSSQSHQVLRPWTGASAPGPMPQKNGRDDFNKQY